MPSIANLPESERADVVARLKRIEGQAKGVQRMVEEERECLDILDQLTAIRAAVNALSGQLLEAYALRCLTHPDDFPSSEKAIEHAVKAVIRGGK